MSSAPKADQKFQVKTIRLTLQQKQAEKLEEFISQLKQHDRQKVERSKSTEYNFKISEQEKYNDFKQKCKDNKWSFDQDTFLSKLDANRTVEDKIKKIKAQVLSNLSLFFEALWIAGLVIVSRNQSKCLDKQYEISLGKLTYRQWLYYDCLSTLLFIGLLIIHVWIFQCFCLLQNWTNTNQKCVKFYLFILSNSLGLLKFIWTCFGINILMSVDFQECDSIAQQFSTAYFFNCIMIAWKLIFLIIELGLAILRMKIKKLKEKENKKFKQKIAEIVVNQSRQIQMQRKLIQPSQPYASVPIVQTASGAKSKHQT